MIAQRVRARERELSIIRHAVGTSAREIVHDRNLRHVGEDDS